MPDTPTCPMPRDAVIDRYFLEHRAKLIDIAAFLDRVDRSPTEAEATDFRVEAMGRAIELLIDGKPDRARRVLELLSDHTTEPIDKAPMKGATGACESK